MAIVPSGTRRFMKLQQATPNGANAPAKRNTVEQEDITPGGAKAPQGGNFNPIGKLDNALQKQKQPGASPKVPDQDALNKAVGGKSPAEAPQGAAGAGAGGDAAGAQPAAKSKEDSIYRSLEDFFRSYLTKVGYEERWIHLILNSKSVFDFDTDDIKNQVNVIMNINKTDLEQLDAQNGVELFKQMIKQNFPVNSLKVMKSPKPGRFEVRFSFPQQAEAHEDFSGAREYAEEVAETAGKIGPSVGKKPPQAKAAYSQNSLIKNSRNSIVDSLLNQGFGGNHAS
jgi:hypothetical protein